MSKLPTDEQSPSARVIEGRQISAPEASRGSTLRLLALVLLTVFVAEVGIMGVLALLPPQIPTWVESILDAAALAALLFPVLLFSLVRPLVLYARELEGAHASMHELHLELEDRVRERTLELQQRNREIHRLGELTDLLQACETADEAFVAIGRAAAALLPSSRGVLYVYSSSRNELEAVATWGSVAPTESEQVFAPKGCWALRKGRRYSVPAPADGAGCAHVLGHDGGYFCVPIIAQGQALGLVHVRTESWEVVGDESSTPDERVATALSEHVALSLVNLRLREELRYQSIRDPLTGLFNRRFLQESLDREIRRMERTHEEMGVVMMDLDHFKKFNDTFGHEAGDLVLREVGQLMRSSFRSSDITCRYGGEEFTVVFPEASVGDVVRSVESFREAVRVLSVRYRDQLLGTLTMSAGVAMYPAHGRDAGTLLRRADLALYRAKATGRDKVVADLHEAGASASPEPPATFD